MGRRALVCGLLFTLLASGQNTLRQNASGQNRGNRQAVPAEERLKRGSEFLGLGPAPDAAAAALGQKLYSTNCAFCHGTEATGAEGPNLIRSSVVLHDERGETIGPVVQNGRPEKGMPAFSTFSTDQLYDIAEFLHQRVYEAANRWGYKVGNIVTGNAAAGQSYFAAHCATCHLPTGDLAHVAAKYQASDLQALFLYPGTFLQVPVSVTVEPRNSPPVTGTLLYQDDFTLVLKERSGLTRAWQTNQMKFQVNDPLISHLKLLSTYTDTDVHNVLAYLVTLK